MVIEGTSDVEDRVRAMRTLLQSTEERGVILAIARSLTGGQIASGLVGVPGASCVLVGVVIAYATRIKTQTLRVDAVHLELTGPADRDITLWMAHGVRRFLEADLGLVTTGVAGPGPVDGHPAGMVYVAVVVPRGQRHRKLHPSDDRSQIRCVTVMKVYELAADFLQKDGYGPQF